MAKRHKGGRADTPTPSKRVSGRLCHVACGLATDGVQLDAEVRGKKTRGLIVRIDGIRVIRIAADGTRTEQTFQLAEIPVVIEVLRRCVRWIDDHEPDDPPRG